MGMVDDRIIARVEPLERDTFAPFGTVIQCEGRAGRQYIPEALEHEQGVANPSLWLRRLATRTALPLTISRLERHPYSAQTFIPLKDCSHLVVVCGTTADDVPDLATLRAFVAGYGQGVSYRRNVWHHGLTILEDVAEFVVIMSLTGRNDDDFFVSLPRPVEIQGTFSTVPGDQNG